MLLTIEVADDCSLTGCNLATTAMAIATAATAASAATTVIAGTSAACSADEPEFRLSEQSPYICCAVCVCVCVCG